MTNSTISDAKKITDFINSIKAFEHMPAEMVTISKNNLIRKEWKVYRFDARVKDDEGFEGDYDIMTGGFHATYCWCGNDEYCLTSPDFFNSMVSKSYKTKGKIVFEL